MVLRSNFAGDDGFKSKFKRLISFGIINLLKIVIQYIALRILEF